MSGHSKWNNIKNRKAATDGKKAKQFGELSKHIRLVVKEGGSGDPKFNIALRVLLDKAREVNMPKEKVQRAIDVGLGKGLGADVREVVYEGFAAGGVPFLVVTQTNNLNRTTGEIRSTFSKAGGSLGSPGSVKYLFTVGQNAEYILTMPMPITDPAQQASLQELIDDLRQLDDVEAVYCVGEWVGQE
jgi:YebC/PmpR family DNA-binding regulatory protein